MTDEGSKQEILSRIAQTNGALTKLKTIWKDKNIALSSKIRLMRSLVISIFLYACETWILTAELEKKIQTTEMRCFRRLLASLTEITLQMRKWGTESDKPLGPMKIFSPLWRNENWDSMGTKQDQQDLQRWSYKEGEREVDRKRDGKTT